MNPENLPVCLNKREGGEFFDEIIIGRFSRISFHRTLRIPDDGKDYPLPAGLGRFPIHRVEDYADKVPSDWLKEGGLFIPLYQKEALFLQFEGPDWHPSIAKVCVGRVNAITGKTYSEKLSASQQDYVVIPKQKWLDGIATGNGTVSQFVAMPLGQGYTIEAQMTDEEKFGGFQLVAYEAVDGYFLERDPDLDESITKKESRRKRQEDMLMAAPLGVSFSISDIRASRRPISMGIAAGGNIQQKIYPDMHGIDVWDPEKKRGITIHIVNSMAYKAITGKDAPSSPITVQKYQKARIPWYSHYDETIIPVKPPSLFKRIMTIAKIDAKRGIAEPRDSAKIDITPELIQKIKTPEIGEAVQSFRVCASAAASSGRWKEALGMISSAIDLDEEEKNIEDYVLRSASNYHLGNYKDSLIDASIALEYDSTHIEAITWRAQCRKASGDFEGLLYDADDLIRYASTELIGLEMKAESLLLSGRYNDAIYQALYLKKKMPDNVRIDDILSEAREKKYQQIKEERNNQVPDDYATALPSDSMTEFSILLAQFAINAGIKTPQGFALFLDETAALLGKPQAFRKFTTALWYCAQMLCTSLPNPESWKNIYNDIDAERK
jgi:hypothetical protein